MPRKICSSYNVVACIQKVLSLNHTWDTGWPKSDFQWFHSFHPGRCQSSTTNQALTISFHILSKSLFILQFSPIQSEILSVAEQATINFIHETEHLVFSEELTCTQKLSRYLTAYFTRFLTSVSPHTIQSSPTAAVGQVSDTRRTHILTETYQHNESVHINADASSVNLKYIPAKNNHDFTHFYHVSTPLYK